jgi:hypothetical protein
VILATATLGHALSKAGLILDALFAAEALCSLGRTRRIAVAATLVLSPLLLAGALWKSTQALHLRHHALLAIAGIVVALAVVAASPRCCGRARGCSRSAPWSRCRSASR